MARPHALNQLVAPGDIAEAVCFSLVRSAKRGASKLYCSDRTFLVADMVPPAGGLARESLKCCEGKQLWGHVGSATPHVLP